LYNSFAFTRNIVALTIFNIVYNTKKKKVIENYIIEIVSIDIDKTKIANIIFNNIIVRSNRILFS